MRFWKRREPDEPVVGGRMYVTGHDRYCNWCGRWLVKVNDDGTFDLAHLASIETKTTLDGDDHYLPTIVVSARCLECEPQDDVGTEPVRAPHLQESDLDAYELGDPKRISLERDLWGGF